MFAEGQGMLRGAAQPGKLDSKAALVWQRVEDNAFHLCLPDGSYSDAAKSRKVFSDNWNWCQSLSILAASCL